MTETVHRQVVYRLLPEARSGWRWLNRVVRNTGWAALRCMLEYKAERLIAVPPPYTSRTCAACGHVDAASRRSQAVFHCVACSHADHADANAARNIRPRLGDRDRLLGLTLLHGKGRSRNKGPRCPDPQGFRRSVENDMKMAAQDAVNQFL